MLYKEYFIPYSNQSVWGDDTHFQVRNVRLERREDLCPHVARWWGLGPKPSSESANSKWEASFLKPLLLTPIPR